MATRTIHTTIDSINDRILSSGKAIALGSIVFDSNSKANDTNQRESIKDYCELLANDLNSDNELSTNALKDKCEQLYIEVMRAVGEDCNFLPRKEFKQGILSIGGRFNRKTASFRDTTVTTTKLITMFFRIRIAYNTRMKAEKDA